MSVSREEFESLRKDVDHIKKTTKKLRSASLKATDTSEEAKEVKEKTPYNKYVVSEFPKIKAKNPDMLAKDIMRLIGEKWSESKQVKETE